MQVPYLGIFLYTLGVRFYLIRRGAVQLYPIRRGAGVVEHNKAERNTSLESEAVCNDRKKLISKLRKCSQGLGRLGKIARYLAVVRDLNIQADKRQEVVRFGLQSGWYDNGQESVEIVYRRDCSTKWNILWSVKLCSND